jgi:hypothetical protein
MQTITTTMWVEVKDSNGFDAEQAVTVTGKVWTERGEEHVDITDATVRREYGGPDEYVLHGDEEATARECLREAAHRARMARIAQDDPGEEYDRRRKDRDVAGVR